MLQPLVRDRYSTVRITSAGFHQKPVSSIGGWSHCVAAFALIQMRCHWAILWSFSCRSNNMQMRDGARQLGYEHLHLLMMLVITPFHTPLVFMVSGCYSSVWSRSESSLILLANQEWELFTYTEKVAVASLSSQLFKALWDCIYSLDVSLCRLAQLRVIQFFLLSQKGGNRHVRPWIII